MTARSGTAVVALLLAVTGCSAAIKAADERAQLPPLLLNSAPIRAAYLAKSVKTGEAMMRVEIPRLNLDVLVVEGTTSQALHAGAGHFATTPYPEARGNVAVFGQRASFGSPFRRLDELHRGDVVVVHTPLGDHSYTVVPPFAGHGNPWVVPAHAPVVTSQQGVLGTGRWLTLVTSTSGDSGQWLVARLDGRRV